MSGLFESGELKERLQQPTTNSSLVHVYFPSYGVFNALKHVSFNGIHQLSILVFLPVSFSLCLSNVHNRNTVHRFSVFFLFLCFFFQISKKLLFISHCLSVCLSVCLSLCFTFSSSFASSPSSSCYHYSSDSYSCSILLRNFF